MSSRQTSPKQENHRSFHTDSYSFPLLVICLSEEAEDDLENAITSTTETLQYDHPNHTVTVTTISDLDLSGARLLGPEAEPVNG